MQALLSWSFDADDTDARPYVSVGVALRGDAPDAAQCYALTLAVDRTLNVSTLPEGAYTSALRDVGNGNVVTIDLPDDYDTLDTMVLTALPANIVTWMGETGCLGILAGLSSFRAKVVNGVCRAAAIDRFLASI